MVTTGRTFRDEVVFADDGDSFVGCMFLDCVIVGTGNQCRFTNCELIQTKIRFTGERFGLVVLDCVRL